MLHHHKSARQYIHYRCGKIPMCIKTKIVGNGTPQKTGREALESTTFVKGSMSPSHDTLWFHAA